MFKRQPKAVASVAICAAAGLMLATATGCSKKKNKDAATTESVAGGGGGGILTSGSLALNGTIASTSTNSGTSLRLVAENSTITCQIEGNAASAVSTSVDGTTGEFSFTAAQVTPFIGQVVRCSVTLADGTVNVMDPFTVPADAVAADVSATYDAASGAISDKVEVTRASGEVVDSDSVYAPLPANLMAFDPRGITGEYARKNCEVDRSNTSNAEKIKGVKNGDLTTAGLAEDCNGWEQQGVYLRGEMGVVGSASPVVQDQAPSLSMWNRKADYDACHVSGSLAMSISDGSNTIDFGNGSGISVDTVFAKIKEFGWAPQVALDRAEAAASSNPPADPEATQILQVLVAQYGEADPCGGFAKDLADDWANPNVGIRKAGGRTFCDANLVYDTPIAAMNTMLNQEIASEPNGEGGLRSDCGRWKRAKTASGRKQALDGFIGMCKQFLAGKPGEDETRRAKLELVDAFLRSIGELKWQTGDSRFDGLKNALKGLNLDTPSGISTSALETLAREWMTVSWDWRARRTLEYAVASMTTAIQGAEQWLNINGMTGRAVIEGLLNDSQTRQNLDELVCSDQWQMPSLVSMVGESSLTALEAELTTPSMQNGFQQTWDSSPPNYAGKKTLLINFIDAYLGKTIGHCERVRLSSQKTQINNATEGANQWDPVANFPQFMLGHQLIEAKRRKVLQQISALLPTGTYSQLNAKRVELESLGMGGSNWMEEELQRYAQKGYDEAGLLYVLKQMLGGEAARDAFRSDATWLAKLQTIKSSACLPDAQISWEPVYDDAGTESFQVQVSGPVKQIMKAPLALVGENVRAVETRLHGGGSCYHGNVNGFSAIPQTAFAAPTGFFSPYMMAWFNNCGGSSSGEDSLNGMFGASKLTPVSNE